MKASFFVFATGLITTMFAAGGVENSITNAELAQAVIVALVGLSIMWVGTLMIKQEEPRG